MGSHPLFVGQSRVDKLAVEHAGALRVRRQEPDHKGDLQLKVKWKPESHGGRVGLITTERKEIVTG